MGLVDNVKDAAEATGDKIKREAGEVKDRFDDKQDERKAEAEVNKAEAERDATKTKNEYKEALRD